MTGVMIYSLQNVIVYKAPFNCIIKENGLIFPLNTIMQVHTEIVKHTLFLKIKYTKSCNKIFWYPATYTCEARLLI